MRLAISNIGWEAEFDEAVYRLMDKYGFSGLEIAPTRIIAQNPYERLSDANQWFKWLKGEYGFIVPSIQSIWYGRSENFFNNTSDRISLLDYTKKAIDFANVVECENLVFGCPRNRNVPEGADKSVAVGFFKELGDYADLKGTAIGMEANPPIYNTNFINNTCSALELIKKVDSKGFKLNLDIGTIIQNNEDISELKGNVHFINHVHISEPNLKPIVERGLHVELRKILTEEDYSGFISIEMGKSDCETIENSMKYIREIFG
jgi:sugar phosphate isomerase/epimerase